MASDSETDRDGPSGLVRRTSSLSLEAAYTPGLVGEEPRVLKKGRGGYRMVNRPQSSPIVPIRRHRCCG